jgi:hydrogenase maturation protease
LKGFYLSRKIGHNIPVHAEKVTIFFNDGRKVMARRSVRVGIIGIGNVLMGDDALGPYAVSLLQSRWEWPDRVELIDGGTPGPELAFIMQPFQIALVIDSVDTGAPPGTLARLEKDALIAAAVSPGRTPHDPGLTAAIQQLELMGNGPDNIVLLGLTPDPTNTGSGLSRTVFSAIPELLKAVISEVERVGIRPEKRANPLPENIWWESQ